MTNYFELLDIPAAPLIDEELLSDHYKRLAAEAHPDQGGTKEQFDLLNIAYKALNKPSARIKHLLEINAIDYDKRGTVSNHLMNFFMSTGELIQKADALIKKQQQASSVLTRALLEADTVEMQERLSDQIDQLLSQQNKTLEALPHHAEESAYEIAARDLSFLENWQAQLKERYASLF